MNDKTGDSDDSEISANLKCVCVPTNRPRPPGTGRPTCAAATTPSDKTVPRFFLPKHANARPCAPPQLSPCSLVVRTSRVLQRRGIEKRVLQAWFRILQSRRTRHTRAQTAAVPTTHMCTPMYHYFVIAGYDCWTIRCLNLNTQWIGFVHIKDTQDDLVWPRARRELPFGVRVDVNVRVPSAPGGGRIVGFHTMHLIHSSTLPGVKAVRASNETLVKNLRRYIHVCSTAKKTAAANKRSTTMAT